MFKNLGRNIAYGTILVMIGMGLLGHILGAFGTLVSGAGEAFGIAIEAFGKIGGNDDGGSSPQRLPDVGIVTPSTVAPRTPGAPVVIPDPTATTVG